MSERLTEWQRLKNQSLRLLLRSGGNPCHDEHGQFCETDGGGGGSNRPKVTAHEDGPSRGAVDAVKAALASIPADQAAKIKGVPITVVKYSSSIPPKGGQVGFFNHRDPHVYVAENDRWTVTRGKDRGKTFVNPTKDVHVVALHELGHAIDHATVATKGAKPGYAGSAWGLSSNPVWRAATAPGLDRMTPKEKENAGYLIGRHDEMFAEAYALTHSTGEAKVGFFGGMTRERASEVFPEAVAYVKSEVSRRIKSLDLRSGEGNPCHDPGTGQFCGDGGGAGGGAEKPAAEEPKPAEPTPRPKVYSRPGVNTRLTNLVKAAVDAIPADHAERIKDVKVIVTRTTRDVPANVPAGEGKFTAGLFDWGDGTPKVYVAANTEHQMPTSGERYILPLKSVQATTVHELGHAVDHASGWSHGQALMADAGKGFARLSKKEAGQGEYWFLDPKEMFAETYSLAYNPNRSGSQRYFGGMSAKRAEKVFAEALGRVRQVKSLSVLGLLRAAGGNPCHEPAGSSSGGQFCETGGGGGGATVMADFARDEVSVVAASEKNFLRDWNKYIGESPARFKRSFLGGINGTMHVSHSDREGFTFTGSLFEGDMDDEGELVGAYMRSITPKTNSAENVQLELEVTGAGYGKKFLAGNVAEYRRMGLKEVNLVANIDVGSYAWAKYGFVPTIAAWRDTGEFKSELADRIEGLTATAAEKRALFKLAGNVSPKSLWAIADSKYGKDLLMENHWSGRLDLKDKDSMKRFDAYVSGRKRKSVLELLRSNECHDEAGQFCETGGGSAGGGAATGGGGKEIAQDYKLVPVSARVFQGKTVPVKSKPTKEETGKIAEAVTLAYVKQVLGHKDAKSYSLKKGEKSTDMIGDHLLVEAKGGLVSNGYKAQRWRSSQGGPGLKEKEWRKTADPKEKRALDKKRQRAIMKRKLDMVKQKSKEFGAKIEGRTITSIINPDTKTADVYEFPGFHEAIYWNGDMAKAAYKGTYRYDPGKKKDLEVRAAQPDEEVVDLTPAEEAAATAKIPKEVLDEAMASVDDYMSDLEDKLDAHLRSLHKGEKEFDESEHPRDESGKFTSGGGDGASDHPGPGYSKDAHVVDGVIHTSNVHDAARALSEDREVELNQPKQASTLIHELGRIAMKMQKQGKEAPFFDLCKVSIAGTNLFCAETKGIPRVEMPQMDKAQTLAFIGYLKDKGYKIEKGTERAINLRATQNQLNGAKVAANMNKYQTTGKGPRRLIVSRTDYILDGHHKWAAKIGMDAADNKLKNDTKLDIWRVDIGITKLLKEAQKFTGGKGAKPADEKPKSLAELAALAAWLEIDDPEDLSRPFV